MVVVFPEPRKPLNTANFFIRSHLLSYILLLLYQCHRWKSRKRQEEILAQRKNKRYDKEKNPIVAGEEYS